MYRFFQKLANFMYGRYGLDNLGRFLIVIYIMLAIANIFVIGHIADIILYGVQMLLLVVILLRVLSRNTYARQRENNFYLKTFGRLTPNFKLLFRRIKDIGKKRYRRCPNCKSVARLPIRRGHHSVKCPNCRQQYRVFILI